MATAMMVKLSRCLFALFLLVPYLVVTLLLPNTVVEAAHPRRRVTIRREGRASYDREITTFTEDGRLAQVEYGLEASSRGSTVAAIQLQLQDNTTAICVCIENSSFGKMHRIDDHLWMLTAGLAGDARMVANQARRACQNHRLTYGEAPTTKQASRNTAEFYHQLTRMGGCRPLGCTAILMGIDSNGRAKLFRTDPGGGFEECKFAAAGNSRDTVAKELMALVEQLEAKNEKNEESKSKSIARMAKTMAQKVLSLLTGKPRKGKLEEGSTMDVWTIEPMKHCRGEMLATFYSDVHKDNVNEIVLQNTE